MSDEHPKTRPKKITLRRPDPDTGIFPNDTSSANGRVPDIVLTANTRNATRVEQVSPEHDELNGCHYQKPALA